LVRNIFIFRSIAQQLSY